MVDIVKLPGDEEADSGFTSGSAVPLDEQIADLKMKYSTMQDMLVLGEILYSPETPPTNRWILYTKADEFFIVNDTGTHHDLLTPDMPRLYAIASGGGTNAIAIAPSPAITAYAQGQRFHFRAQHTNTGPVTLNVNGQGPKAIKKHGNVVLVAGDIKASHIVEVVFITGTNLFEMTSQLGNPPAGGYTDAQAITAVEGEATLDLTGDVTIDGAKTLKVDVINEKDVDAGVTADGVLHKDGLIAAGAIPDTHGVTPTPHHASYLSANHGALGDNAPHHIKYTDAAAKAAAATVKLDDFTAPDDNTDLNASSTKHGLVPKLPNDATLFFNGVGGYTVPYTDAKAVIAAKTVKLDDFTVPDDNTDLNASTSKHGLTPKYPNDATKYLDGTGVYSIPAGAGGGGVEMPPVPASASQWCRPGWNNNGATPIQMISGWLTAHPIYVNEDTTYTAIGVHVTTAGAGGKLVRLGIYNPGSDHLPGTLKQDCGTVSIAATGAATITVNITLETGFYWIVYVTDDGCYFKGIDTSNAYITPATGIAGSVGSACRELGIMKTGQTALVAGGLADPFPAAAYSAIDVSRASAMLKLPA
ncbi:hypothetical protein LCGC14_0860400 [marine sediment metagenome]|uniref:Uncharacterized protein n=1 Tax=marine sediment metagenome TaxID=412755 RepID=A0A0F9PT11_9ZZZZ